MTLQYTRQVTSEVDRQHDPHVRRVGAALGAEPAVSLSREAPPIAGAVGATDGARIWAPQTGSSGYDDIVLAHELAHAQAARGDGPIDTAQAEVEADVAAAATSLRLHGAAIPAPAGRLRARSGLALAACTSRSAEAKLRRGETLTAEEARGVFDRFDGLDAAGQEAFVREHYSAIGGGDGIRRLIASLPPDEQSGGRRASVARLLELVERIAAETSSGVSSADMVTLQHGTWVANVEAEAARAAAARGSATVTDADRSAAGTSIVQSRSLGDRAVNRWDALGAGQAAWTTRATVVAQSVIDLWNTRNPTTPVASTAIVLDPSGIEARGATVIAFASSGRIHVGLDWIAATDPTVIRGGVAGNPENGLANIAHEVFGHPDFGSGLAPGLIRGAAPGVPGVDVSTTEGWKDVYDGFAYFETEIYAELREYDHLGPVSLGDDPETNIRDMLGELRAGWNATVARAIVVGLNERVRLDPRVSDRARALYVRIVNAAWGSEVVR